MTKRKWLDIIGNALEIGLSFVALLHTLNEDKEEQKDDDRED